MTMSDSGIGGGGGTHVFVNDVRNRTPTAARDELLAVGYPVIP
jgi:hypothetical protein